MGVEEDTGKQGTAEQRQDDTPTQRYNHVSAGLSKRALKRHKQKETKKLLKAKEAEIAERLSKEEDNASIKEEAQVEIIQPDIDEDDPRFSEIKQVLQKFNSRQLQSNDNDNDNSDEQRELNDNSDMTQIVDTPSASAGTTAAPAPRSHRALKLSTRLTIPELKQLISTPSVVELHDVNSPDPKLLVSLKSYNNSVPVPAHWSAKKKYLSSKRGYEKLPFHLPDFIVNTGISKIRGVQLEKEAAKKSKAKQREKMRPRMGAIDIDYQILHDAFFRYQHKPVLTELGSLYYEGREFEVRLTEKKPTIYSPELCAALGMASPSSPPPWLVNMQRIGPPPSYPFLRIPGVNAPLPPGGKWGLGEAEWGNAPIAADGTPRWGGDLFGVEKRPERRPVDVSRWGEIHSDEDEAEEKAEEEEKEADTDADTATTADESKPSSRDAILGTQSVASVSGFTTPAQVNLRKHTPGIGTETPNTITAPQQVRKELYTVLEEKQTSVGSGLLGTTHTYVIPPSTEHIASVDDDTSSGRRGKSAAAGVNVALNPDELEHLDAESLKRKFESQERETFISKDAGSLHATEDDDDIVGQLKKKRKVKEKEKEKFKF